ncbi:MAG: hypothetical protein Q9191_006965 [Dirinaria sp. TL-2023a]
MPHPGKDKALKARIREELEQGIDPREIANRTDIPLHTIRRWHRNLKRYGQMNELSQGPPGNQKRLSHEMQTYLLGYLHGRPDAYLAELRRVLQEAFSQDVSIQTISRVLKSRGCMVGRKKKSDAQANLDSGKDNAALAKPTPIVPVGTPFGDLSPGPFAEGVRDGMNWARLEDSEMSRISSSIPKDTVHSTRAIRYQAPCPAPAVESHHSGA